MTKIIIAGKNDIAVNALDYIVNVIAFPRNECAVCLNKADTGQDTWQKSLKKYAQTNEISLYSLEEVQRIEKSVFISLEFDRIIRPELFRSNRLFNLHFSKLPAYKGMYTSILPILNGDTESGVTLHKIDSGIDTGEIIAQKTFTIDISDTARDLYFKYLDHALHLFKENIQKILDGEISSCPQAYQKSSYFSKKSINFDEINIDLQKSSFEIHNQIRAFIFKEYQLPQIKGIYITKSEITSEFIGYNKYIESEDNIILSGIDGYKVVLTKAREKASE